MKYDYLIVGSGLFGSTFAYRATKAGRKCLVIDKRPHLGGNVYCQSIDGSSGLPTETEGPDTIHVHKYGAHIFHTSKKEVWDFVNSIVVFNRFTNSPLANYKGELYNLPFNMNTFYRLWPDVKTPAQAQVRIEEQKAEALAALNGREPQNLEEEALCLVGRDMFQKFIKEYTEKQWGRDCKHLPAFIIKRIPVRMTFDNNYFSDRYQGIPVGGYNKLIGGLLEGVDTRVNFDFFKDSLESQDPSGTSHADLCPLRQNWQQYADRLVYTGALDEYFGYRLGKLHWRTLTFKTRVEDLPNYQGNAVVNYTSHEQPYTRVIEHKHFEMFGQQVYDCPKTVISEEYSAECKEGQEPFCPINDVRNNALAEQYRQLAEQEERVIFGGRLGQYKYYDMAPIIEHVLSLQID